ncbi:MAG TPA: CapA family protein [Spirochaetia bacterium]|nr:CapA family protein [Spirochaetia bacterium]
MRQKAPRLPSLLVASLMICAIAGAARPGSVRADERLLVDAPGALWPVWQAFVARHPLPPGVVAQRAAPAEGQGDTPGAAAASGAPRLELRIGPIPGLRVVARVAAAPTVTLGDPRMSATLAEVRAGKVPVQPVAAIAPPNVAIPVDGEYPGDPEYPLYDEIDASLAGSSGAAQQWLMKLPVVDAAAPDRDTVDWIGAVGDIMPARGVDSTLLSGAGGVERVFGDTLPVLRSFSLLLGNLEATATGSGPRANKSYTFRFDARAVSTLVSSGFSYLSLTNNHTFDFGSSGFLETLAAVQAAGAATSGVGENQAAAAEPFVTKVGDTEVRILSFADYPVDQTGFDGRKVAMATPDRPGMLWLDSTGLEVASRGFRPGALNIAMVHGGQEWSHVPTPEQRAMYRSLVDAGATVVIGSHPHVLEGLESYHGGLIAYSVGNFLFPGMQGTDGGEQSVILRLGVYQGAVRYVEYTPVRLSGITVRLDRTEATVRSLQAQTRALR